MGLFRLVKICRSAKLCGRVDARRVVVVNILAADAVNGPRQVRDQASLSETTVAYVQVLAEWGRRLAVQEPLRYVQLLPLIHRTTDEVTSVAMLGRLVPAVGQSLPALVGMQGGRDAGIFVEGLTTARVLAWALHDVPEHANRLPALLLAALFQDVGRTLPPPNGKRGREFCEKWAARLEREHPAVGAAMLGTIPDAPVELPLIVGQHHERLDGGGFPRGLAGGEILPDAAILAAATRFARLCLAIDPAAPSVRAGTGVPARAAQLLLAEAKWGMWPVEFATRLCRCVDAEVQAFAAVPAGIPSASPVRPAERSDFERDAPDRRDRSRQLHGREQGPPGLHVGSGRRPAEAGWYEKKMLFDRESR